MQARHTTTALLILLVVALFIVRIPLDNYMCDPKSWRSQTETTITGKPLVWRPEQQTSAGDNFFTRIFRGGGGTPAIFAMLGGQRYMVANILWNFTDVLFHKGEPFKMIDPLESVVTLNPTFTEAWSLYGWHVAWNLHTYVGKENAVLKAKYIRDGEEIYRRAVEANPEKPKPYFDMAWLFIMREGNYEAAMPYLQRVVETDNFPVITPEDRKRFTGDLDTIRERKWDSQIIGHRLAYVYKKMWIITGHKSFFTKAVDTFKKCLKIDPNDKSATANMKTLLEHENDAAWLKKQLDDEVSHREKFGMAALDLAECAKQGKQVVKTFDGSVPVKVDVPPELKQMPSSEYYKNEYKQ
jgi:tetratricopeptide (TPR) repeat protein